MRRPRDIDAELKTLQDGRSSYAPGAPCSSVRSSSPPAPTRSMPRRSPARSSRPWPGRGNPRRGRAGARAAPPSFGGTGDRAPRMPLLRLLTRTSASLRRRWRPCGGMRLPARGTIRRPRSRSAGPDPPA